MTGGFWQKPLGQYFLKSKKNTFLCTFIAQVVYYIYFNHINICWIFYCTTTCMTVFIPKCFQLFISKMTTLYDIVKYMLIINWVPVVYWLLLISGAYFVRMLHITAPARKRISTNMHTRKRTHNRDIYVLQGCTCIITCIFRGEIWPQRGRRTI